MRPSHAGSLAGQVGVVSGQAGLRDRGASVRLWLQVLDQPVFKARFEVYGCPHLIAAAENLCAWCEGQVVGELKRWSWQTVATELATHVVLTRAP